MSNKKNGSLGDAIVKSLNKTDAGLLSDPNKETAVSEKDYVLKVKVISGDTRKWKIVNMKDFPELFKVVDGKRRNIITNAKTEKICQDFIDNVNALYSGDLPDGPIDPPEPTHDCPEGEKWDEVTQKCIPVDVGPTHECPEGQVWDEVQLRCVDKPIDPPVEPCPEGQVRDPVTGNCVDKQIEPSGDNVDKNGVIIMQKIKEGGQSQYDYEVARTMTSQSNEDNIPRDSVYGKPKLDKGHTATDFATVAYFRVKLSTKDQIDFKRLGGKHSSSGPEEGQCYPVGLLVTPGKPTTGWLAKEYPKHPNTPNYISSIKYGEFNSIPDCNGKTVGLQTIGWVTKQGTYKIECYVDTSVMDTPPKELTKAPNQWKLFFTAEDTGHWDGPPFKKNNGVDGDGGMFIYGRVDHVTDPTTVNFVSAIEIVAPN
jgi:hypothetical protein